MKDVVAILKRPKTIGMQFKHPSLVIMYYLLNVLFGSIFIGS